MAARSQPGNDPLRADLLARMVALPGNDPGRGQRVLQSVGSIAVIVLLAIVCVYARDEGVAGNPLFQHVLPLRQAPVVATFCVIFLLGLNFGDGSILPLAWCGCLLMMPVPFALSYGQAESEQAVEEIAGYYLVYQQRPFVLLVGSCCLGVMHACLVAEAKLRRGIALAFLYGLLLNPAQTHYLTGRAEVWLSGAITCTGFTVGFGLCELRVRWHASAAPGPLQKERHSPPRHAPPPSPPTSPAPAPAGPLEGAPRAEGEIHPAVQVHPMLNSWAVRAPPAALAGQATLPPRFFVDEMRQDEEARQVLRGGEESRQEHLQKRQRRAPGQSGPQYGAVPPDAVQSQGILCGPMPLSAAMARCAAASAPRPPRPRSPAAGSSVGWIPRVPPPAQAAQVPQEQPGRSSGDELTIEDLLNLPTSEDESAAW